MDDGGQQSVANNSVNPGFGKRYVSFDESSERTAVIGCKPVRLMNSPGGLCLWMQKALKTPAAMQNPRKSVYQNSINPGFSRRYVNIYSRVARFEQARLQRTLIREYKGCRRRPCQSYFSACSAVSVVKKIRENPRNPWLKTLYICRESSTNSPFYAKQTQFPSFFAQKPRFAEKQTQNEPKTNPILSRRKRSEDGLMPSGQSGQSYFGLCFGFRISLFGFGVLFTFCRFFIKKLRSF
jgi:hypothetical protein